MSKLQEIVDEKFEGIVIRQYLKEELKLSSRLIRSASIDKRILVNGKAVRMRCILHKGDKIEVILDSKETQNIAPEKMNLDIVYVFYCLVIVDCRFAHVFLYNYS